jgi:hypothetical protein
MLVSVCLLGSDLNVHWYESGTILSPVSAEWDAQVPLNVTLHG